MPALRQLGKQEQRLTGKDREEHLARLEFFGGDRQPSNAELVTEAVALCSEAGRPVASCDEAAAILGPDVTVQGNIDPALLSAPWSVLEEHVRDVLERGRAARAHILNLGHGVPPETDPDQLTRIVELVHAER